MTELTQGPQKIRIWDAPVRVFHWLMVLCFAGMYRLVHSRIGHICMSLQQNEELASSIGVNIANLRLIAFAISSFLGGVSGDQALVEIGRAHV